MNDEDDDRPRSSRDDIAPEIQQHPEGSLEQASPSLRHLAANPYTFEGSMQRGWVEVEIAASGPGWRRWVIRSCAVLGLLGGAISIISIIASMRS